MRPAGINQFLTFFFRAQGRIGRVEYLLGAGLIYVVNLAILSFALNHPDLQSSSVGLLWLLALPSLVAVLVLIAKRCHDLGLPGVFVILAVLPFVGVFWAIALAIIPGNTGPNRYGAAPEFGPD